MRWAIVLATWLVSFPAWGQIPCSAPDPDISAAIQKFYLESNDNREKWAALDVLMDKPEAAACQLVEQLRRVPTKYVSRSLGNRQAMHVVWSIRALRRITKCMDFVAPTRESFGPSEIEQVRKYFLTREGIDRVPFFATWMSRDSVAISTFDVQDAVIEQWKHWLATARNFKFEKCEDMDNWYF